MITECALLQIRSGQSAAFEVAFREASGFIRRAKGYLHHRLEKCVEQEDKYLLLVGWEELLDHTEVFRGSADYAAWKALLHGYYEPFPTVEHYYAIQ